MNNSTNNRYAAPSAEVSDINEDNGEMAGRGTRLVAVILDGLMFALVVYVPLLASIGTALFSAGSNPANFAALLLGSILSVGGVLALVGFLGLIVLNIIFVKRNGQSVGKKMMGIKVVRTDGSQAGLGRIFWLRNFINGLIGVIPFVGGIYGLIDALMIFSEPRRCVHDRIADTMVIKA